VVFISPQEDQLQGDKLNCNWLIREGTEFSLVSAIYGSVKTQVSSLAPRGQVRRALQLLLPAYTFWPVLPCQPGRTGNNPQGLGLTREQEHAHRSQTLGFESWSAPGQPGACRHCFSSLGHSPSFRACLRGGCRLPTRAITRAQKGQCT